MRPVVLVVDVANVVGSRPDGWWRDRSSAATRLLTLVDGLAGRTVAGPADEVRIDRIVAVVEGAARDATAPQNVELARAARDGDTEIVGQARQVAATGAVPLVITADRALRARLSDHALTAGPEWLNGLLGR